MPSASEPRLAFEAPIYEMEARLAEMEAQYAKNRAGGDTTKIAEQIRRLRRELAALKREIYAHLDPWQIVQVSRHPQRPQTRDYIELIFEQFIELHGDRAFGDDQAIVTGLAHLDDIKVMFIGHQKGKNLAERTACHFGCAHPEGYRKALRKMQLAAKFGLPIISFIDTPGAYPGITAEERGQAAIIAENLMAMSQIRTPIVCVVIGEGGSGGALGIGIGDRLAMLEFTYYSVITPEGCASILWKGSEHAPKAAAALKMTSRDLLQFGIIDEVIPEPPGGAHRDHREAAATLKSSLIHAVRQLKETPTDVAARAPLPKVPQDRRVPRSGSSPPSRPRRRPGRTGRARLNQSNLGRHDKRRPILAREHGVGLGVVDERLGRGVDVELAAQAVGDVAQVAVGARKVSLFDVGVQELVVARLDGLDEVGEVVAVALAARALLELAAEEDLPVLVAADRQDALGAVEDVADLDVATRRW